MANANSDTASEETNISDILDHFVENTDGDEINVGDLVDALNSRSFGPILLVPSLIALSPIGAIPGMSLVTGGLIFLVAGQMLITKGNPWLPNRLLQMKFSRERLEKGVKRIRPWAVWVEKAIHERLKFLAKFPFHYGIAIISMVLAVAFYPLALLPGAVFIPALAMTLFSLGLAAHDGALILVGYVVAVLAAWVTYAFWPL